MSDSPTVVRQFRQYVRQSDSTSDSPTVCFETVPIRYGLCATSTRQPGQVAVKSCQAAKGAENAQRLDRDRLPAECTPPTPQGGNGGSPPHTCFETGPIRYGLYATSTRQPGQEAVRSCQAAKGAENAQRLDQRRRRTFSPALYQVRLLHSWQWLKRVIGTLLGLHKCQGLFVETVTHSSLPYRDK